MADSAISIFNIINFVYEWSDSANKDRQMEISHIKHCFCSLQFNKAHTQLKWWKNVDSIQALQHPSRTNWQFFF